MRQREKTMVATEIAKKPIQDVSFEKLWKSIPKEQQKKRIEQFAAAAHKAASKVSVTSPFSTHVRSLMRTIKKLTATGKTDTRTMKLMMMHQSKVMTLVDVDEYYDDPDIKAGVLKRVTEQQVDEFDFRV